MQKYLGRAEDVVAQLEGPMATPQSVVVGEYGGSRAVMQQMAQRLRLAEHVNAVAPKRDLGMYVVLAVIHRIVAPCSKVKLVDGYHRTARG